MLHCPPTVAVGHTKSALVVSVGVIVGLLALVLSNNPRGARTAAKAAAATVVALFERYQQRAK